MAVCPMLQPVCRQKNKIKYEFRIVSHLSNFRGKKWRWTKMAMERCLWIGESLDVCGFVFFTIHLRVVCRRRKKLVFILTESFRQAEHLHNTFYLVVKIFRNWKFLFFNVLPCNNQKCLFMVALLYYEVNFHWRNSDLYYVLGELISRSILNQSSIKDYDFDVTGFELWYNWRSKARTW